MGLREERGHVVACRPKLLPQPDFPYSDGEHEEILRPFEINMRVYTLLCMKKKDRAIQVSLKLKPNFIA